MELKDLLRKLRGKESLRKVSRRAGISHNYLSIIEKGIDPRTGSPVHPSPETLKALAKAYSYPYEDLLVAAGYIDSQLVLDLENPGETRRMTMEETKAHRETLIQRQLDKEAHDLERILTSGNRVYFGDDILSSEEIEKILELIKIIKK